MAINKSTAHVRDFNKATRESFAPTHLRPLHQPTQITLRVDGPGFPGFPPDTIRVEPHLGTVELLRGDVKLASGELSW